MRFFLLLLLPLHFSATARNCRGNSIPGRILALSVLLHAIVLSNLTLSYVLFAVDAFVLLLLAAGVRSPSLVPRRGLLHVLVKRTRQCVLGLGILEWIVPHSVIPIVGWSSLGMYRVRPIARLLLHARFHPCSAAGTAVAAASY